MREIAVYNPEDGRSISSSMRESWHASHVQFGFDANDTLWQASGGSPVVGWLNTKMWDATHDAAKPQGWTAMILDTNANGKRDDYMSSRISHGRIHKR